jgi:hypothetical protein
MRNHLRCDEYVPTHVLPDDLTRWDVELMSQDEIDSYVRVNVWLPDGCPLALGLTIEKATKVVERWNAVHG